MKAPTQYVMYFTHHADTGILEDQSLPSARAFSPDLKTWTLDPSDVCSTSGDLCKVTPLLPTTKSVPLAGTLQLPDGRIRMFQNDGSGHLKSTISSDGITWTLEPGIRLTQDTTSIYERGNFALQLVSFVTLPNGNIRMYYEGGVVAGSAGTPAWYQNYSGFFSFPLFVNGAILSAVSTDGGLTWVRDPGVRINQLVQGPAIQFTGPTPNGLATSTQYDGGDVTSVVVTENGKTVYRIYGPTVTNSAASYVSSDGLTFSLEGQIPSAPGDPKAFVLPDGRVWLITNQYPDAFVDMLVYGPQSFAVNSVHAAIQKVPAIILPGFKSVMVSVTGTSTSPVTLSAPIGVVTSCSPNPPCSFHPEYFTFSPATGTPPFSSVVTFSGPSIERQQLLIVHASSADTTSVGSVDCMSQPLGNPGVGEYCSDTPIALPLTSMRFGFSGGSTTPVTQTSNIMSLGGPGYPFTATSSVPWATVSPASGTAPLPLQVKVDPTGLAPGTYTGIVTVSAETTQQTITVTTTIAAGPVINAVQNAASIGTTIASDSFITIFGSGFATSPTIWTPTTDLPTTLGGVSVIINGKPGFISYADPSQINVLTPPDPLSGTVNVEVSTAAGKATANLQAATAAPAWFSYNLSGTTTLAAVFATSGAYVAPAGAVGPTVSSQSAHAGDFLALFANGLGATNPVPPGGKVLGTYYPIDDLSRVKVTVAGVPAQVLFAGVVGAGLFQVNIQVPAIPFGGDVAVVMTVDGIATQFGVTLNMLGGPPLQ